MLTSLSMAWHYQNIRCYTSRCEREVNSLRVLSHACMPRLDPQLLRKAHCLHPYLSQLLLTCRDLPSAKSELRWLREHANKICKAPSSSTANQCLRDFVRRRSQGEPLQYILGSEYFGGLEIKCRPGVLIPRLVCRFISLSAISFV